MHTVLSAPPFVPCATVAQGHHVPVNPSEPHQPRVCGIVTIQNESYVPKNERSYPPTMTDSMGREVAIEFARAYNVSEHARQKKRWAVVTTSGGFLLLCGIDPNSRPTSNADYPECVQGGMTLNEAIQAAADLNAPRFEHARVPRQWTIAVQPLTTDRIW